MDQHLTWNDTYEIALLLVQRKSCISLHDVSLGNILEWTKELPGFSDNDLFVDDQSLMDIFRAWLEEDLSK